MTSTITLTRGKSVSIPAEFQGVRIDWDGTEYVFPEKDQVWEDRKGRLLLVLEVVPGAAKVRCEVLPFGRRSSVVEIDRGRMKPVNGYSLRAKSLWQ